MKLAANALQLSFAIPVMHRAQVQTGEVERERDERDARGGDRVNEKAERREQETVQEGAYLLAIVLMLFDEAFEAFCLRLVTLRKLAHGPLLTRGFEAERFFANLFDPGADFGRSLFVELTTKRRVRFDLE